MVGDHSAGDQDGRIDAAGGFRGKPLEELVEVVAVVRRELGDDFLELPEGLFEGDGESRVDHRADGVRPRLLGEDRRGEEGVVDIEKDRLEFLVGTAHCAPSAFRAMETASILSQRRRGMKNDPR